MSGTDDIRGDVTQLALEVSDIVGRLVEQSAGVLPCLKDFDTVIDRVIADFIGRHDTVRKLGLIVDLGGGHEAEVDGPTSVGRVIDVMLQHALRAHFEPVRAAMLALLYRGRLFEALQEVSDVVDILVDRNAAFALPHEIEDHRALYGRFLAGDVAPEDYVDVLASGDMVLDYEDVGDADLHRRFDRIIMVMSDFRTLARVASKNFADNAAEEMERHLAARNGDTQ